VFPRARLDLSVEAARERIFDRVESLPPIDARLTQALGLTLPGDIVSPIDLPRFTNSAMDGIALPSATTTNASTIQPARLRVLGNVDAGQLWNTPVAIDEAVRIGTGAALPNGCDAVIPAELITERDGVLEVTEPIPSGTNVRHQGEDIRDGAIALSAGTTLRPQEVGLLAALGVETIKVIPRPAATIVSIGPELLAGTAPALVNDANGPMLAALAERAGAEVVDIVQSDGDLQDLFDLLDRCADTSDLVITSGGISNSLADTMADLLEPHSQAELWNVRLRPGKHFGFAWFDDFYLLSVPGNPIAALAGFEFFGRPIVDRLLGRTGGDELATATAAGSAPIPGRLGRTDAIRGRAWREIDGRLLTTPTENRGSSVLSSLPEANCLILLGEDIPAIEPGEPVPILWIGYQ
jgi:molybdopterin molybdotransferase